MMHPLFPRVHSSHKLDVICGVLFCTQCGSHGVENSVNLSRQCPPSPSKSGKEVLSRLSRGLPPKSGVPWPR
eukprot:8871549-Pyramimonas_sp.AAC.1